jgi:hypothetical protein
MIFAKNSNANLTQIVGLTPAPWGKSPQICKKLNNICGSLKCLIVLRMKIVLRSFFRKLKQVSLGQIDTIKWQVLTKR